MTRKLRSLAAALTMAGSALLPLSANAAIVNWSFEATIDNNPANPFAGNTMRWDFTFDTADLSLDALSITVQGLGTTTCNTSGVNISYTDVPAGTNGDLFSFSLGNDKCGDLGIYTIVSPASISLRDINGVAFNPWSTNLNPAEFDRGSMNLDICSSSTIGGCVAGQNKFTLTTGIPTYAVPEPGALALLGLGLAGLALTRRRKQ